MNTLWQTKIFLLLLKIMLIVLALNSLVACGSSASPAPAIPTAPTKVTLKVSGSGTTSSVLQAVKPAFEADVPGYTLNILAGTGTGGGVKGIIEGVLDVAAMARPPTDDETKQGVDYTEFGKSATVIFTHPEVGVTNLTTAQVAKIFSGDITNWSEVGGPNRTIILYVRDEGDSSTKGLRQVIFGDTPFPECQVMTSQVDMQAAIAGTSNSVGFGSWPAAMAMAAKVQPISLDGVAPDNSGYPVVSPVGVSYLSTRKAEMQPLIDWLLSEKGRAALARIDMIITP